MRALIVILGAVVMLVGVATQPASAGKGTDFDQFIKRIQKFAVADIFAQKPRSLCVCQDGGAYDTRVGALKYSGQLGDQNVTVRCWVHRFNPDGSLEIVLSCDTFEVLSK